MEPKLKLVRKQNLVEPWFHGTVEHVEPQFVNLLLSNNASKNCLGRVVLLLVVLPTMLNRIYQVGLDFSCPSLRKDSIWDLHFYFTHKNNKNLCHSS